MNHEILEFTAHGSPLAVSRIIEEATTGQGSISAIVVPWESDKQTLSMAVTAVKTDGWAIEHTNLGTIKLREMENDSTRVTILMDEPSDSEKKKMLEFFDGFAKRLQNKLQATS